jgi:hypothetical protein
MGSPPSLLSVNGLVRSCRPPKLLRAAALSTRATVPVSGSRRWVGGEGWRWVFMRSEVHAWGSGEEREYEGKGALTSLPIFLDSIAGAVGAATVPLRSSFCACGLIYGTYWRQPYKWCSTYKYRLLVHSSAAVDGGPENGWACKSSGQFPSLSVPLSRPCPVAEWSSCRGQGLKPWQKSVGKPMKPAKNHFYYNK